MFTGKQLTAIILILLTLFIIIQNSFAVRLHFLFLYTTVPLSVLLVVVFLIGLLLGFWIHRKKKSAAR